jgi:apolipoprotein N-acyltransferase
MGQQLLRVAYGIEFLIALMATFEFWSQVGGQSHLDLMPWWLKFVLSLAVSAGVVRLTAVQKRRDTLIWAVVLLALIFVGGMLTFYFHIYEPQDSGDEEQQLTPTLLQGNLHLPCSARDLYQQRTVAL